MSEKTKAEVNGEFGAFACASSEGYQQGLTKREYFAVLFIQGELAGNAKEWANEKDLVQRGLLIADELLNQLSNEH